MIATNEKMEIKNCTSSCSESDLKALLYGIKGILGESFMTCNSGGKDGYNVLMQTKTLKDAHKLHRLLCEVNAL